jgi:STE24 endopeptidase
LAAVLAILVGGLLLDLIVEILNIREVHDRPPGEFDGIYEIERFRKSREYLRETTRFSLLREGLATGALVAFILLGGFDLADRLARSLVAGPVPTGLVFFGCLGIISVLFRLPFSAYRTFRIEERYGFNRTTVRTFVLDFLKGLLLAAGIGGAALALVLGLFDALGPGAWVYAWAAVSGFQVVLLFLTPVLILPLFHRYRRVADESVREAVEGYVRGRGFRTRGVFEIDGSRRSTKANAFFTGFGRFRRIVLYDTLIREYSAEEIVAIVAHEAGHWQRKHLPKFLLISILKTGVMFLLLSWILGNRTLFDAFGVREISVHAALVFFGILYAPVDLLLSLPLNALSRRHEYEADAYAVETTGDAEVLVNALKKLTVDHLAHVTPHRLKVFLEYSHPPILRRIEAIRSVARGDRSADPNRTPGFSSSN